MGDNTEPAANHGEVDRQVAEAILFAQRILGFNGVADEEMMGRVQMEQQKPTDKDMLEKADEQEREQVEGEDKRKC